MALVCPGARYASLHWAAAPRLERRFATPADWAAIEREIAAQLPPTPLPATSGIVQVLTRGVDTAIVVRYIAAVPVEVEGPDRAAEALDAELRRASVA